eukprot:m.73866 g.73866  ORF g.73866 m.73866 type:complete len:465 (-) comp24600_c1_seq1:374-1768(-)
MERPDEQQVRDLASQFQEITGVSDVSTAEAMLEAHGWNLTNAMNTHFSDSSLATSTSTTHTPPRTTDGLRQRANVATANTSDNTDASNSATGASDRPPRPTNTDPPLPLWRQILDTILRFALIPADVLKFIFTRFFGFGWSFFASLVPGTSALPLRGELKKEFDTIYSDRHPRIFDGSLVDAMNFAKKELKYLIIVIHSPKSEPSNRYLQDTITSEDFTLFSDNNLVMWAVSTADRQGVQACTSLRVSSFPSTALVAFVEGQMKVVWRQSGFLQTPQLLEKLAELMEQYQPAMIAEQQERSQRVFDRQIRQQQDQEYEASLQADRERELKKNQEQAEKESEEKNARETKLREEQEAEEKLKNRGATLAQKRQSLPEVPKDGEPSVKLRFKFPNGQRLDRVFSPDHKLQCVYDFVDIHGEEHDISDDFSILTQYPMKKLEGMDSTLAEVGLKGGGQNLNVQDNTA